MDIGRVESIIDGYVEWWRRGIEVYPAGDGARIVSPMLDRHNDHMSMYLADDPETGGYVLTDLGATIGDLAASGCDVLASEPRTRKLDSITSGFGLSREGEELYRKTNSSGLFQSMSFLMQGMATVDDLFFTVSDQKRSFFLDDIAAWFWNRGTPVVPNVRIEGRSGFETRFDFVIPKTHREEERLVKAIGNPSRGSIENALFGFGDIRDERPESTWLIIMNLSGKRKDEGKIAELENACSRYGARPIVWDGTFEENESVLAA